MVERAGLLRKSPSAPSHVASLNQIPEIADARVHLATFHQQVFAIYDQIFFLKRLFKRLGVQFSIGEALDPDCLNIVIEDFSPRVCEVIERFHSETGKWVGIVATEHLDAVDGRILSYAELLFAPEKDRDYVTHAEGVRRFAGLARALRCARYIFTLGDYPHLRGIDEVFPRCPIVRLPFPPLPMKSVTRRAARKPEYDLVFTGSITPYRREALEGLTSNFSIVTGKMGANFSQRARNYWSAAMALNVPQYREWIWSSPMRILYGLAAGRVTISPRLASKSQIDTFAIEAVELSAACVRDIVDRHPPSRRLEIIEDYQRFAEGQVSRFNLEKLLLDWSLVDGRG
jgi:hypothetical protein